MKKKKKFNLNRRLIFYFSVVMISIILIMAVSISVTVDNKIFEFTNMMIEGTDENLLVIRDTYIKDINNLAIGISLLMIIVVVSISVFMSQKISKPIIVVSKMTDAIKKGGYDQVLEYDSSIIEIDNLISSINSLAKELDNMEKMRKRLTSDISHELRTPLTSIQTHLEAMIDGIWEPNKDRLISVNEEVIRLNHLINELKKLTQFDREENKLHIVRVNLRDLIKNIIYNYESYALGKNILIESNLKDVVINIDKEKISQVIINLISNAIRYTCDDGKIYISCYEEEHFAKIHVKDNGRGIPKESLDYIFERFYRVDDSRCRKTGGTGIGLTISKSIVDLHRGRIEVISELNKGSEFIIYLPQ